MTASPTPSPTASGNTDTGTVLVKVGAPTGSPASAFPNGDFEADTIGTAAGYALPVEYDDLCQLALFHRRVAADSLVFRQYSGCLRDRWGHS